MDCRPGGVAPALGLLPCHQGRDQGGNFRRPPSAAIRSFADRPFPHPRSRSRGEDQGRAGGIPSVHGRISRSGGEGQAEAPWANSSKPKRYNIPIWFYLVKRVFFVRSEGVTRGAAAVPFRRLPAMDNLPGQAAAVLRRRIGFQFPRRAASTSMTSAATRLTDTATIEASGPNCPPVSASGPESGA